MRSVPLWVGKSDDSPVPDHVRLRIFRRHDGRCWLSGRKITPADKWDLDHKIALCLGGAHSEDNLAPAIVDKHREKTAQDVAEKARVDSLAKRHIGIKGRKPHWPKRKMQARLGK